MKKEIPIYDAVLNDLDGLSCISLVDCPAMETDMMVFAKQDKPLQFAVNDELQHCITSVVIRADYPVYRYSQEQGEYYIRFSKELIKQLAEKYSKDGLLNQVSVHHNGELLDDITMIEFFIKDTEKGINPTGFENIEEGSLFCTFKINNRDVWESVLEGEFGGLSMEVFVDIEKTDETIEEEQEDFWAELMEWLGFEDEKKKFKRLTKGDVQSILDKNRKVNITIGEQTLWEQQIFQIGEDANGKIELVVFDPQKQDWSEIDLRDIDNIKVTDLELENYDFNAKWKEIVENNKVGIIDTAIGHTIGNTFKDAIETNRMVMISYNDELEDPATGYRNCLVTSLGYTTGSDGTPRNQAIRIYEYSGDSRTGLEGGTDNWRFMLTRRIKDFKIVDYADPIMTPPDGYNGERQHDSGKWGTMSAVEIVMQFPPIRKS